MRKLEGTIISDKMKKTRVVVVQRMKQHPRYEKYYKVTTRYKAHDAENTYHVGERVVIQEARPHSKEKRWVIVGRIKT